MGKPAMTEYTDLASLDLEAGEAVEAAPQPRFTQADADALNERFAQVPAARMLREVLTEVMPGQVAMVSSFGTESSVLLHLAAQSDPNIPVIFIDTLRLFPETLRYRDQLAKLLGLTNVQTIEPLPENLAEADPKYLLWSYNPDACCAVRKVEPLARALTGVEAWISGRKAFQAATRANIPLFEIADGRLKINPLARWTREDLIAYMDQYDLPRHPLEKDGYLSIGCMPCTSPVKPGEDPRAGRWRGWDKTECGIHTPVKPGNEPVF